MDCAFHGWPLGDCVDVPAGLGGGTVWRVNSRVTDETVVGDGLVLDVQVSVEAGAGLLLVHV